MKNRGTGKALLSLGAFLLCAGLLPGSASAAAQNKFIAKRFRWHVAESRHFDIHYYEGGERLLAPCAADLERAFKETTGLLGITISRRCPFFLFLTHNDFEQNNIVDVGEGTGGVTEAFKDRILVFNDGSREWLQHVILHEFVHRAQFEVLYAGFWRSVRLIKSVLYPLWFMEGMAEYATGDLDRVQEDMVLRDAVSSRTFIPLPMLHGFNHVKPHQVTLAYKTGSAALRYIAREYGPGAVGALLKSLSEKFDMSSTLQEELGLNLSQLSAKVEEDLGERYAEDLAHMKEPMAYGEPLTRPDGIYPVFNSNPAFAPDGNSFFYLSDNAGQVELFQYDLALARSLPLKVQESFPHLIENIQTNGNALSVFPDGRTLLFAGESRERDYLYLFDLERNRLRRLGFPLDGVSQPQISPDGKKILFVGMREGANDLYLCRADGSHLERLMETEEDENSPRFFPDGGRILFSREHKTGGGARNYERDLWEMNLSDRSERRLTNQPGSESQPAISPDGREIVFVGDGSGANDLYRLVLGGGAKPERLTEVVGGNFHPVYSPSGDSILFVSHRAGEQHIYRASRTELLAREGRGEEKKAAEIRPAGRKAEEVSKSTDAVTVRGGRPYAFRASTDFFFPIFFYSSTDGLYLSAYWQASEMLGNHQLQAAVTYASAFDFLNYQIFYSYLKFRPQIFFGFVGDTQENVLVTTRELRREDAQFVGVLYPLSRFDSVQLRLQTTHRRVDLGDDDFITERLSGRENLAALAFSRDVSRGRYLETTRGYRIQASYEESDRELLRSGLDYRNLFFTLHHFLPVHRESTLAFRAFGGASFGSQRQFFRVGGSELLRGFGRFDGRYAASRFAMANLELRFPLVLNANTHIWFFFPDFLFKNIYMALFTDNGLIWNSRDDLLAQTPGDVKNSFGAGLRFQAFVLQTFPVILRVDWARRTADGEQAFYFNLGPTF